MRAAPESSEQSAVAERGARDDFEDLTAPDQDRLDEINLLRMIGLDFEVVAA